MKTLHTVSQALLAIAAVTLLSGCGGNSDHWGIDHPDATLVTHGPYDENLGHYRCTIDDAILVKAGQTITPIQDDTHLRVWHYQNSQEYVCTLQGEAIIQDI